MISKQRNRSAPHDVADAPNEAPAHGPPPPPPTLPSGANPSWLERLVFVDALRANKPRRKTAPKLDLLDSMLMWSMHVRLGATTAYLASEFNVSEASALDTITTITRIVQLRMLAFGMRLDDDEIDILLGPSQLLRREFWDTTKVPRARARKKWSHDIDNNLN